MRHSPLALKIFGSLLILMVVGVIAFFMLNNYIYEEKQRESTYEPYRARLSGSYSCLPHKDSTGPQADECAPAVRTEAGEYYALDFNLMSQPVPSFMIGDYFAASGVVTPIERLSSAHWQQYEVEGIFSVTDAVERQ